jgi:hypothetical protein
MRRIDLNSGRAQAAAVVAVPLAFGLLSLYLGQDANWDLLNYHLYSPFAYLNGKLDIDLAPAGTATYLNPALDLGYYFVATRLPAPLLGFLLGVIHGSSFLLILGIARAVLRGLPREDAYRVPLLLAAAGCLTANFLSEIGNTMADNTTALFELGALLGVVSSWDRLAAAAPGALGVVLLAGVAAGAGAGFKLTNAVYALALCFALLLVPGGPLRRLSVAFVFGCGVLIGLGGTAGFWFAEMWQRFGNPLFPHFGSVFPNPLTENFGMSGLEWHPAGLLEAVLWPFLFSLDSSRVLEVRIHQVIWAIAYALFWWWAIDALLRGRRGTRPRVPASAADYTIAYVVIGYLIWLKAFSYLRYAIPIEMLLPLVIWIWLARLLPHERARRHAAWALSLAAAVVVAGGTASRGHVPWASRVARADVPKLDDPPRTTVLLAEFPMAWIATSFPVDVAFAAVHPPGFPESPAYVETVHRIVERRGGRAFVIVSARVDGRAQSLGRINDRLSAWGLLGSARFCSAVQWTLQRSRMHAVVRFPEGGAGGRVCELEPLEADKKDLPAENRSVLAQAEPALRDYGFALDAATCTTHDAYVGAALQPYQFCRVRAVGASAPPAGR